MEKRQDSKKGTTKALRRAGQIPAVLYSRGNAGTTISINEREFAKVLDNLEQGHLATTIFSLEGSDGKAVKAIVKGIEYARTTYQVLHLDFMELHDDVPVSVKVPINVIGEANCVGIKLGGFLRLVIRGLKVTCLPKDMPAKFDLDIQPLQVKQVRRLSDIVLPEGVKPMQDLKEVAIVIAKR
jgi:large subunit ribosomal protein L25